MRYYKRYIEKQIKALLKPRVQLLLQARNSVEKQPHVKDLPPPHMLWIPKLRLSLSKVALSQYFLEILPG